MLENAPAHTPGPFVYRPDTYHHYDTIDGGQYVGGLCVLDSNTTVTVHADTLDGLNAVRALIAAAPDLLAACEQLVDEYERGPEWVSADTIDRAANAIARAMGN